MKKFKIMLTGLLMSFAGLANAQFMGLDSVALGDDVAHIMLKNASKAIDPVMLDKWRSEKGSFYIPYDGTTICYVGFTSFNSDTANKEKYTGKNHILSFMNTGKYYPLMTSCDKLPLIELSLGDGTKIRTHQAENIKKYTLQMIEDLGPEQWEQLMFVILNRSLVYEVRKAALDKFKVLYPERLKHQTKEQAFFMKKAKDWSYRNIRREAEHMMSVQEPIMFMFDQLLHSTVDSMQEISKWKGYERLNSYSRDFWNGKKDVDTKVFDNAKGVKKGTLLNMYRNAMLMREIMNMPGFNINYQNKVGNTYLHTVFSDVVLIRDLSNNKIFADFMRATLDQGLNPMLLNNNKETAFHLFEKNVTAKKASRVFDAFMLKEYPN